MSGTSVDAVDVAVCRFAPSPSEPHAVNLTVRAYQERPIPAALQRQVRQMLAEPQISLRDVADLHVGLGQAFADAVLSTLTDQEIAAHDLDLIACHGQTIYHLVEEGRTRATLQLGEAAEIAARTGVTVAADFRPADVAAGGQGAPLVSLFDALFFQHPLRTRAIQNIGGIGNVTFLPAGRGIEGAYAFDTGPGNMIIDYAVQHVSGGTQPYDHGGVVAAQGIPCRELVKEALSHPFFAAAPPKTTGRETFGDAFGADLLRQAGRWSLSGADILATATAITAESIARAYRHFGPERIDEVVVSGGGARNATLLKMLRGLLPASHVLLHDDFGVSAESKEAVTFALLGYELLHGRPSNVPVCTGARSPVILGKFTPGANYRDLMRRTSFRGPAERTRRLRLVEAGSGH